MHIKTRLILVTLLVTTLACSSVDIFSQSAPTPTSPPPTEAPAATATTAPTAAPTSTSAEASEVTSSLYALTERADGWQEYQNFEYHFSIDLPPNWVVLDLTSDNFNEMFNLALESNPEMENIFSSDMLLSLATQGVKLYALDANITSTSTGTASNLNLLISELPFSLSLDDYLELNIAQLESMFAGGIQIQEDRVTVAGVEAGKLIYQVELNNIYGQVVPVQYEQYLFLIDNTQYVLTFVSAAETYADNAPIFGQVIDSMEIDQ